MLKLKVFLLNTGLVALLGGVSASLSAAPGMPPVGQMPGNATAMAQSAKPVVMLKVNGEPLSVQDYANFLQRNPEYVQAAMSTDAGKVEAIQMMVGSSLIHAELLKHPEWLAEKDKKNQAAINEAYGKLAAEKFPPPQGEYSEEKLFAYYQAHPERFGIPEMVRVSQIQFAVPEKATEAQKTDAKSRAETAFKRLEAGEDFGTVAAQLTENKLARLPRGDLGFIGIDQSDWLHKATASLKQGERTGVLESPAGYEILLVTDRRPQLTTPYANVRNKIIQILKAQEQRQAEAAYMRGLAKNAKIEVVQPELQSLFPKGVFPE